MSSGEPVIWVNALPQGPRGMRIGAAPEPLNLSGRILSLEYVDKESGADELRLEVDNYDLTNFDDPVWAAGTFLSVAWGYVGNMTPARVVVIRKVTGFQVLQIEARGVEVVMNRTTRARTFENMTRSAAVEQVAREWGWTAPDQLHIEDSGVVMPVIHQARMTDANFVRRMATKLGYEWYVDWDGFHFHKRVLTQRPLREFNWYTDPDGSNIEVVNVENDITAKPAKVKAKGRDPVKREDVDEEASNGTLGALRQALSALLPEGIENDAIKSVLDSKPSAGPLGDISGETGEITLVTATAQSSDAAKQEAEAIYTKAQQVAVKMTVTAEGDPQLFAKSVINATGLGKRLSQKYYVREVTHRIQAGYRMEMEWVSDGIGGHSADSALAKGLSAVQPSATKGKKGPNDAAKSDKDAPAEKAVYGIDGELGEVLRILSDKGGSPNATAVAAAAAAAAAAEEEG